MANTYKIVKLEPYVRSMEVGGEMRNKVVVKLYVCVQATSDDDYPSQIDAYIPLQVDPDNFIEFDDLPESWPQEIADKYIEENNWHEALDRQIEALRVRPLPCPFKWQRE